MQDVLEECLRLLSDIPEEALAGVLRFVVARADAAAMTEFVASKFTSSHERARRGDEAVCAGIEHFVYVGVGDHQRGGSRNPGPCVTLLLPRCVAGTAPDS